jgi:hypothetical protein
MLHHQPESRKNYNSDGLGDHSYIYAVVCFGFRIVLSLAALVTALAPGTADVAWLIFPQMILPLFVALNLPA